ncbi:MAG: DUF1203 domain-containing protein [Terrimesophilobacter sp.]
MNTLIFTIRPVDHSEIDRARQTGIDVNGNPAARMIADGGEPLRCCLTDAHDGDDILLFGYRPSFPATGPYVQAGAVFTHATECGGPGSDSTYPSDWLGRPQVLRAFDERGWIHPATTRHDGTDAPAELAELLAQEGVVEVHSLNINYGCFMFSATQASMTAR